MVRQKNVPFLLILEGGVIASLRPGPLSNDLVAGRLKITLSFRQAASSTAKARGKKTSADGDASATKTATPTQFATAKSKPPVVSLVNEEEDDVEDDGYEEDTPEKPHKPESESDFVTPLPKVTTK